VHPESTRDRLFTISKSYAIGVVSFPAWKGDAASGNVASELSKRCCVCIARTTEVPRRCSGRPLGKRSARLFPHECSYPTPCNASVPVQPVQSMDAGTGPREWVVIASYRVTFFFAR